MANTSSTPQGTTEKTEEETVNNSRTIEAVGSGTNGKDQEKGKTPPTAEPPQGKKEEESYLYPDEEEVTHGDWTTPQVDVDLVDVRTGEEDEEIFWSHRAKLFRWDVSCSAWKERGIGDAKLLKHCKTNKIRFLLRQEKTLKVVANHYVHAVNKLCTLSPNVSSDKIWVWSSPDSADNDHGKVELFGLKFGQLQQAKIFKEKFEEAAKLNAPFFGDEDKKDNGDPYPSKEPPLLL